MTKAAFVTFGLALAAAGAFFLMRPAEPVAAAAGTPTPVVVELFTSEGCSSCPPADALLMELDKQPVAGAEIVALGQHVDYWDRLGWRDRFSSHEFTERQNQYSGYFHLDSIYTPQMVVDGQKEFVGNSRSEAYAAIQKAARSAKPVAVKLDLSGDSLTVSARENAPSGRQSVYLALTESSLESNVGSGENSGRRLRHTAVVRSLKKLGELRDGEYKDTQTLALNKDWNRGQLKAVVFVQSQQHGQITGAAELPLGK